MKNIKLIFLLSIWSQIVLSQRNTIESKDLNNMNLKGKVKTINETSYNASKIKGTIVKSEKGWQYEWEYDQVYYFDTLGYLRKHDEIRDEEIRTFYSMTLDTKNRIIQITNLDRSYSYVYDSINRIVSSKEKEIDANFPSEREAISDYMNISVKFYYDSKKRLIKKERFEENKKIAIETFTYDSSGNLILSENNRFAFVERYKYTYDENNLLVQYEESDDDGISNVEYYHYLNQVKIAERLVDYDDGQPMFGIENRFENGNIIATFSSESDDSTSPIETCTYEFDENQNWIRKIINELGDYYIVERKIEYY